MYSAYRNQRPGMPVRRTRIRKKQITRLRFRAAYSHWAYAKNYIRTRRA
jgi:hypothetical protein